jgi:hypothetical protein
MSTDEQAVEEPASETAPATDETAGDGPSWWHRDHPTFSALTGFFTGLLFVALVPAVYVAVLSLVFDNDRVEELFPFVLVTLVVPLALVMNRRTRRYGTYFWIGIVLTAVVVIGVATVVLWYLVDHQG